MHAPFLGRGGAEEIRTGDSPYRAARKAVDRVFGERLAALAGPDRYQVGDVGRRVLERLGVSVPIEPWQQERAKAILASAYYPVRSRGITAVLIAAGIESVRSVRERLIKSGQADTLDDAVFDDHLFAFRRDAAHAREREIDWLVEHIEPLAPERELSRDERRRWLLEVWFDLPGGPQRDVRG